MTHPINHEPIDHSNVLLYLYISLEAGGRAAPEETCRCLPRPVPRAHGRPAFQDQDRRGVRACSPRSHEQLRAGNRDGGPRVSLKKGGVRYTPYSFEVTEILVLNQTAVERRRNGYRLQGHKC